MRRWRGLGGRGRLAAALVATALPVLSRGQEDSTPPVVSVPADITITCAGVGGTPVTYSVTATDDRDPNPQLSVMPPSGSFFPEGVSLVTCVAVDASGNTNRCGFTVTVRDPVPAVLAVVRDNQDVVISWPASCANYLLQRASSLAPPVPWAPAGLVQSLDGTRYRASAAIGSEPQFFSLTRLGPPDRFAHLAFVFPAGGAAISGHGLLVLQQGNPDFDPRTVAEVVFEYSTDGGVAWQVISAITGLDNQTLTLDPHRWQAFWDTAPLAPGPYLVQARMTYRYGPVTLTPSRQMSVTVNRPPAVNSVGFQPGAQPGEVIFDGSDVSDPDGTVTTWRWDFGDPAANTNASYFNNGSLAITRYADLQRTNPVSLTVTDNRGASSAAFYLLSFVEATPAQYVPAATVDTNCRCVSIKVRTKGNALGPKGDGSTNWPAVTNQFDGRTLGPLNGNPSNYTVVDPRLPQPEKLLSGFAFEVVANVVGNPAYCHETQLIKQSAHLTDKAWDAVAFFVGSGDRNLDTANEMTITNEQSCLDAGGTLHTNGYFLGQNGQPQPNVVCGFPQSGTKYAPDGAYGGDLPRVPGGHPHGAYGHVQPYKTHPSDGNITWFDSPSMAWPGLDSWYKADFVAMIRGTDGKVCYVKYSVSLTNNVGVDTEQIAAGPDSSLDPVTGDITGPCCVTDVPGVP